MEAALTYPTTTAVIPGALLESGFAGTMSLAHAVPLVPTFTTTGSDFTSATFISAGNITAPAFITDGNDFTGTTLTTAGNITGPTFITAGTRFTGTITFPRQLFETAARERQNVTLYFIDACGNNWATTDIEHSQVGAFAKELLADDVPKYTTSEQLFNAIQSLYLSGNRPRDRQIAERITALHRDALADDERIRAGSLAQFTQFFLAHSDLGLPKLTLTPDGTLRARWIHGPGDFVAVEFTGRPTAKLVAEIPREGGLTATHFDSEPVKNIVSVARAIGASFSL
jgi:hypothetical protein